MVNVSSKTKSIAQVIARIEGYNKPGTLAQRQNNPGNLMYVGQAGARRGKNGFAHFITPDLGWSALHGQIMLDAQRGKTLQQFVYKYAPPSSNNSRQYLSILSAAVRAKPSEKLINIIR